MECEWTLDNFLPEAHYVCEPTAGTWSFAKNVNEKEKNEYILRALTTWPSVCMSRESRTASDDHEIWCNKGCCVYSPQTSDCLPWDGTLYITCWGALPPACDNILVSWVWLSHMQCNYFTAFGPQWFWILKGSSRVLHGKTCILNWQKHYDKMSLLFIEMAL